MNPILTGRGMCRDRQMQMWCKLGLQSSLALLKTSNPWCSAAGREGSWLKQQGLEWSSWSGCCFPTAWLALQACGDQSPHIRDKLPWWEAQQWSQGLLTTGVADRQGRDPGHCWTAPHWPASTSGLIILLSLGKQHTHLPKVTGDLQFKPEQKIWEIQALTVMWIQV